MRRHLHLFCLTFLLVSAVVPWAYSQSPSAPSPEEVGAAKSKRVVDPIAYAIGQQNAAFVIAFNEHDAKAVAGFWTQDGEYIDGSGETVIGRESIETYFTEVFAARPDASLQLVTDSVRSLSESAALEDGQSILEPSRESRAEVSSYTAVHVKVDGKWLLASVRDSWIDTSLPSDDLADLDWLIGEWTAEENGVVTESKCRWIVNNRFVERAYTTTEVDGTITSGVQIIGWNAQANHVQSWNFTPDGGHGIGVWSATEAGWLAKVTGTNGAGVSTSAVNLLRRLDDNAYFWQSMDRTVGEVRLPDTDEVIIRRKLTSK